MSSSDSSGSPSSLVSHGSLSSHSSGATAARFLIGKCDAIERIAGNRTWLLVGAVLVAAGGLARHYDKKDLLTDPTVLPRGFVVSVVNSLVMFTLVFVLARAWREREGSARMPFGRGYLAFLATFWMTAPMAWLYGVPYEWFLDPVVAVKCNIATLALVSVWRVWLSSRALAVIYGVRQWCTLFPIMLFSDLVMMPAIVVGGVETLEIMSGVEGPRGAVISNAGGLTAMAGMWTLPVWLIGSGVAAGRMRVMPAARLAEKGRVPRGSLVVAVGVLLLWIGAALLVQNSDGLVGG